MNKIELTKKHKEKFDDIRFLALAVAKDDARPMLQLIKVKEDGTAIACDGFRIHTLKNSGLTPGYYSVAKLLKSKVILEYEPDMEGLYPDIACFARRETERIGPPNIRLYDKYSLSITASTIISVFTLRTKLFSLLVNYVQDALVIGQNIKISCEKIENEELSRLFILEIGKDKKAYIQPIAIAPEWGANEPTN